MPWIANPVHVGSIPARVSKFVASVAQLEEHQIVVLVVMGSIPIRRPIGLWSPPQETVPVVRRQAISFLSPIRLLQP